MHYLLSSILSPVKKYVLFLIPLLFLYGCDKPIEDGIYTVLSNETLFENQKQSANDDVNDDNFYVNLKNHMNKAMGEAYLKVNGEEVTLYLYPKIYAGVLDNENRVMLDIGSLQLERYSSKKLQFISRDFDVCQIWRCTVTAEFVSMGADDSPFAALLDRYIVLENEQAADRRAYQAEIMNRKKNDFLGEAQVINDLYNIKLMPLQSFSFERESLNKKLTYGALILDPNDERLEVYKFRNYNPPKNHVHNISSSATLFILPVEDENADFSNLKSDMKEVYYEDENSLFGKYILGSMLLYYHYDAEHKNYIIGQAHGDKKVLLDYYNAFKSITTKEIEGELVSFADLALSSDEFQARYGIQYETFLERKELPNQFEYNIKEALQLPNILYNELSAPYEDDYYTAWLDPSTLPATSTYFKIHTKPLVQLKTIFLAIHPQGMWVNDSLIYHPDPKVSSGFSTFYELQEGVTLEISSASITGFTSTASNLVKILYIKQLENYDFSGLPDIPKAAVPNIRKYTEISFSGNNSKSTSYRFEEGITDLSGNLLPDSKEE